ncbi:hypothetical protein [Kitasatospora sp. NPDC001547]|uniref:hypothetical protein n=1 Tax=Kitasatospora sp. NPDC001547 TaxID=3364015 RepID=UPI0036C49FF4
MPFNSYCKIYVSKLRQSTVSGLIGQECGCEFSDLGAEIQGIDIEVRRNPDSDPGAEPEDFVFWPVIIEVEAESGGGEEVVDLVAGLLRILWESEGMAVASCDFEDRLPWEGGAARLGDRRGS